MRVNHRELFKIVGEETPALSKIREAMDWLLQKGLAQEQLEAAYARHKKPISITETASEDTAYYNLEGEHTIKINPKHLDKIKFSDGNSEPYKFTYERSLAHELEHAGQDSEEMEKRLVELQFEPSSQALEYFDEAKFAEGQKHLHAAIEAKTYESAIEHLEKYVDEVGLPLNKIGKEVLFNHPEFAKYAEKFEKPAMQAENRVAAIQGQPMRTDYARAHSVDDEATKEMLMEQIIEQLDIDKKIKSPSIADCKSWVNSLGARTGAAQSI